MAKEFLTPIDLNGFELQQAAIQNLAIAPSSPSVGQVYYDTVEEKIKIWDGTTWDVVGDTQEEIEDHVAGVLAAGNAVEITYDDAGNSLTITNIGVTSLAGEPGEVTVSSSAGSVVLGLEGTISSDTTGNAATATKLQTARTISFSGGGSGSATFDGSGDTDIALIVTGTDSVTSLTGTPNEVEVSASVGDVTIGLPDTINVDVVGDLTGNASTASQLEQAQTIAISGALSGSASFDGSSDITINVTSGPDSVTLGQDTTGDYVASISGTTNEVEVTGSGEGSSITIGLPDDVSITNDLSVLGNVTISGSAVYVDSENVEIADAVILLNSNETSAPTQNAGVEINRGTQNDVSLLWDESTQLWSSTNDGTNYRAITRRFSGNVGDGSSTVFYVTHNLGTVENTVKVYNNSTKAQVVPQIERVSDNTVKITFPTAPSTDAYGVVIVGTGLRLDPVPTMLIAAPILNDTSVGVVYTSKDAGVSWTPTTLVGSDNVLDSKGENNNIIAVDGFFYAIATHQGGKIFKSLDGSSWENVETLSFTAHKMFRQSGVTLIVGTDGNIARSTDMITWTERTYNDAAMANPDEAIIKTQFEFMLGGDSDRQWVKTTNGGSSWTYATIPSPMIGEWSATFNSPYYVVAGRQSFPIYSTNGITWTVATTATSVDDFNNMRVLKSLNGNLVGSGYNAGGASQSIVFSTNGVTWYSRVGDSGTTDVTYGNGAYYAVSSNGIQKTTDPFDGFVTISTQTPPTGHYFSNIVHNEVIG